MTFALGRYEVVMLAKLVETRLSDRVARLFGIRASGQTQFLRHTTDGGRGALKHFGDTRGGEDGGLLALIRLQGHPHDDVPAQLGSLTQVFEFLFDEIGLIFHTVPAPVMRIC
jgi:hypothetical protein